MYRFNHTSPITNCVTTLVGAAILALCRGEIEATSATSSWLDGGRDACRLADLFLRTPADGNGNARPINILPATGKKSLFKAEMDYNMKGFNLEASAAPRDICEAKRLTPAVVNVDPGSFIMAEVEVKSLAGHGVYDEFFTINVSRLFGSETVLRALQIRSAQLVPRWTPEVRNYSVLLDVEEDIVMFSFLRRDEGQVVTLVSELEEVTPPSARALGQFPGSAAGTWSRSVWDEPIGEVQHQPSTLLTAIDVGFHRVVYLNVESADQSSSNRYHFSVRRPACPAERRFFDGDTAVCTDVCNDGHFGNPATGRCSACLAEHCAACDKVDEGKKCSVCLDGFTLSNGLCVVSGAASLSTIKYTEKAVGKDLPILVGSSIAVALACFVCFFLVRCPRTARGRPRLLDGDDDDYYDESYRS